MKGIVKIMTFWGIFISSFFIGFSGAMMPGPMLGITINGSLQKGYLVGPLVVFGHGILEVILIIFMVFGLQNFFSKAIVAGYIGIIGGFYLTWMGYGMIKASIKKTVSLENQGAENVAVRSLVLAGAIVSATNPFFILWWATAGIELVRQSSSLGLLGILLFFIGHFLADLTWYLAIATAFSKGKKLINDVIYRGLILLLGLFILGFSLYFIKNGWRILFGS